MQRTEESVGTSGDLGSEALARLTCVYTTLIGGYEKLNEQSVATNSRLPFICLTDDPDLRSETGKFVESSRYSASIPFAVSVR
jgi:hypothetical protein